MLLAKLAFRKYKYWRSRICSCPDSSFYPSVTIICGIQALCTSRQCLLDHLRCVFVCGLKRGKEGRNLLKATASCFWATFIIILSTSPVPVLVPPNFLLLLSMFSMERNYCWKNPGNSKSVLGKSLHHDTKSTSAKKNLKNHPIYQ